MLPKALNQMTVPNAPVAEVFALAKTLGCQGVELRNDLGRPLCDGLSADAIKDMAAETGQEILAVAEVKAFNLRPTDKTEDTIALITFAAKIGAKGVALIPHVGDTQVDRGAQRDALRHALVHIMPLLQDAGMVGLIEPIGFATSSLRHKSDVAAILTELNRPACYKIVHDTFHHHLSGDTTFHPEITGLVHISGVTDPATKTDGMTDAHRVLIDAEDRLENIQQLRALEEAGYKAPISFECFAPEIHQLTDPAKTIAESFAFISSQTEAQAA